MTLSSYCLWSLKQTIVVANEQRWKRFLMMFVPRSTTIRIEFSTPLRLRSAQELDICMGQLDKQFSVHILSILTPFQRLLFLSILILRRSLY